MAKYYGHQLRAETWHTEFPRYAGWITKLEIQFWHIFTPLMQRSWIIQRCIRFVYNVIEGRPLVWVFGMAAVFSIISFFIGYFWGLLQ